MKIEVGDLFYFGRHFKRKPSLKTIEAFTVGVQKITPEPYHGAGRKITFVWFHGPLEGEPILWDEREFEKCFAPLVEESYFSRTCWHVRQFFSTKLLAPFQKPERLP